MILLAHIAQRIFGALAIELVDRHEVSKVQHVDFFELTRRPELRRHDIERDVDEGNDRRIALPDTGGLDNDEIETGELACGNDFRQRSGNLRTRRAGSERAHEDVLMLDRIHPDTIAQ